MNLKQFKKELMKDKEFAKEYGKFDLLNYITGIRIKCGLTTLKFIFFIIGLFIIFMIGVIALEL